jgi:hypothetical protein
MCVTMKQNLFESARDQLNPLGNELPLAEKKLRKNFA